MSDNYQVKDINLAPKGRQMIDWAESRMPVLMHLRETYKDSKPFKGAKIAGCIHITKETAVLVETLQACGAEVFWSGCNPLSTNDAVAAALAKAGVHIYAWHGQSTEDFYNCIEKTVSFGPNLTLDDGADLIFTVHNKYQSAASNIIGGTEETTTGVARLRAMAGDGKLLYPIFAVNDSATKWDFDNVYGTGQSSLDGILRATSILVAGKYFVVAGYGHCGRGVALRAKGLGAKTIVTEIDPVAALRATLEGHEVMTMDEACKVGDIFITATGMKDVIIKHHFENMKDGAVVCNTGHYDCELNLKDLNDISSSVTEIRANNEEYKLKNGKRVYVLAQGRLVNLAAAEGHPSEVMDMSFANQFLALKSMFENGKSLEKKVYTLPAETDQEIAMIKLKSMGHNVDVLTPEQIAYATDYSAGT
ncbi:MAG: adenosylhomocysteinase [Bdellovibrionales bacterium]|nr:adenosylhomocysteinase [Bdellovibrionales bacterium]